MTTLKFVSAVGKTYRKETLKGREQIVVPVVALVEGVVHAMNAKNAEFVSAEEFGQAPMGWNGKPVVYTHPMANGKPVSANSPDVTDKRKVGTIFNTVLAGKKLKMEAWLDVEDANACDPEILERVMSGDPIEVSVGVFVETDDTTGEFKGKEFEGAWHNIVPDHLALLKPGDEGACSREMGCGVRAAGKGEDMYVNWLEAGPETDALLKTLRNIPQSERDKMDKADFAGPNESFPIAKPVDVADAAKAIGRAKGDPEAIKKKIISIAYRKGASFVAQLPEAWKKKKDQKNASGFARLMAAFRSAVSPTESDRDVRDELLEALREMEPNVYDIVAVYSDRFVYPVYEPGGVCLYQRAYSGDEASGYSIDGNRVEVEAVVSYEPVGMELEPTAAEGKRHSKADQQMVQTMHDHAVALGAYCDPKAATAPKAASSCGCETADSKEKTDMAKNKTERIAALIACKSKLFSAEDQKMLETATDEQLTRFEATGATLVAASAAATPAVEVKPVVETPAAAVVAPKDPTFEELLAKADPALRDSIAEGRAMGEARKANTVKALKDSGRCDFSDEKLKAMSQAELDQLIKLAGLAPQPRAAIDFSGAGAPKSTTDATEVPAPPDFGAAVKAAQASRK